MRSAARLPLPRRRPAGAAALLGVLLAVAACLLPAPPLAAAAPGLLPATGDAPLLIPRLRYGGGGDWYTDPTSLPNLLKALGERFVFAVRPDNKAIAVTDGSLFEYPVVYLTGHGNVRFEEEELARLRQYLDAGGLLWADDCYGMDTSFRQQMKRLFPDPAEALTPLSSDHAVFHQAYDLAQGIPKIHEHDGRPPVLYGIVRKGRICVLYSYETDIGDGLEDEGTHEDTPQLREDALRMAIDIVFFAMSQ